MRWENKTEGRLSLSVIDKFREKNSDNMKNISILRRFSLIIVFSFLFISCRHQRIDYDKDLFIPIGRSFLGKSEYVLFLNDHAYDAEKFYDGLGGYWLKIPLKQIKNKSKIKIQYTRKRDETPVLFHESSIDNDRWIKPSGLIDSDNPDIAKKANEIINGCVNCQTNVVKAQQIQNFVIHYMTFKIVRGSYDFAASEVYRRKYGICINYSRLFVAMCRAGKIPARTVEGIVYSRRDPTIYDGHHEWAEVMDENGNWHQLDFTYSTAFDLSDIRYLDLIFDSDENPYYKSIFKTNRKPYQIGTGDIVVYSVNKIIHDGFPGLGYQLIENRYPSYFKVENEFFFEIRDNGFHVTK
jgi:hypothetical protein